LFHSFFVFKLFQLGKDSVFLKNSRSSEGIVYFSIAITSLLGPSTPEAWIEARDRHKTPPRPEKTTIFNKNTGKSEEIV